MKGAAWIILVVLWLAPPAFAQNADELPELLRARLESAGTAPRLSIANEIIHASSLLPVVYDARDFAPVWIDARGPLPILDDLLDAIRRSADHGLRPSDYHLQLLQQKVTDHARRALTGSGLIEVELLATDAFLVYASHLLAGHVDPNTVHVTWFIPRPEADLAALLEQAASTGRIRDALEQVAPAAPAYGRLKGALAEYRSLASRGGWPALPPGETLRAGDRGARVAVLRKRLAVTSPGLSDQTSELLDDDLQQSVKIFQRRHGLTDDGVVGVATSRALNVTVEERIAQIQINLERWRWLPVDLGHRHILVNIAGFRLYVVESNETVMTMRAIVGRPYRNTPIFTDEMTYLVFSPYWHVPRGIAGRDILPKVQKDPGYLHANGFQVFRGWDSDVAVDPGTVAWASLTGSSSPLPVPSGCGPAERTRTGQVHVPEQFQRLPSRHPEPLPLQRDVSRIQLRLRPHREAGRARVVPPERRGRMGSERDRKRDEPTPGTDRSASHVDPRPSAVLDGVGRRRWHPSVPCRYLPPRHPSASGARTGAPGAMRS